jgi:hypothetical protein
MQIKIEIKRGEQHITHDLKNEFFIENHQEYNRFIEPTTLHPSFFTGINKILFSLTSTLENAKMKLGNGKESHPLKGPTYTLKEKAK